MEVRRPFKLQLPDRVHELHAAFRAAGHELYVVGGAVRDAVMGRMPKDFDLATGATPDRVTSIVAGIVMSKWSADLTGQAFGVIRARALQDAVAEVGALTEFEIATFREDLSAGRHPEVRFATIKEDVQRRDLTINALFYDIERREIVDLVGGLQDIELGLVRTVGDPRARFAEDPLRKLRAVRFASRLGYALDHETASAIRRDPLMGDVSPERRRDEFTKAISCAQSVPRLMRMLDQLRLLGQVLPALNTSIDLDALVSSRGIDTNDPLMAIALLLDRYGTVEVPAVGKRLKELKYSVEEVDVVTFLLRFRDVGPDSALALRRHFQRGHVGTDRLAQYFLQRGLPDRRSFEAFSRYLGTTPVSGDLLLAQGYSGRALGVELERRERELFCGLL